MIYVIGMEGKLLISDRVKKGYEKAPHRSLFKAMGYTNEELALPLIGVVNSQNEIVPAIYIWTLLPRRLKWYQDGGRNSYRVSIHRYVTVLAMNHVGMNYSLASRRADSR